MPPSAKARRFQLSKKNPRSSPNTFDTTSRTSGSAVGVICMREGGSAHARIAQDLEQVLAVAVFGQSLAHALERRGVDVAQAKGDLFRAGDLQTLPALDRLDVLCRLEQRLVCAGVEPGH